MVIVETYHSQIINKTDCVCVNPSDIGARVKLSKYGREMQKSHNKTGTVIDWNQWMHYTNQGTVTVKWDNVRCPVSMDISQIELSDKTN